MVSRKMFWYKFIFMLVSVAYTSARVDDIIDSTTTDGSQESPRPLPKTILDPVAYLRSKAGRTKGKKEREHSEKEA
jgi:hypothetical protein